jgi:AmmeMemoRadiSam system protein A
MPMAEMSEPPRLTPEERLALLNIARRTLEAVLTNQTPPLFVPPPGTLHSTWGAFVTLRSFGGRLRGCIGRLSSDLPLYRVVRDMTIAAALEDPRFASERLTAAELSTTTIEISILSRLELVTNPLAEVEPGRHGVYVVSGTRTGVFLPHVATEMGWDTATLLSRCCERKAGLPPDAWSTGLATVYRFCAEVIEEPHLDVQPLSPFGTVLVSPAGPLP